MQKQQIPSKFSTDKLSHHSRSVRRLYNRINNNIKVLNKSRISNTSNNSIGSVALRRTQLSNDKIYSREEEFLHLNNSSQFGGEFQSGVGDLDRKKSIPLTPLQSNQNYRQRIRGSKDSRSQRSDSQKSSKYRPNLKKYTRNDIEKFLMMDEGKNVDDRANERQQRQRRKQKQKEREKYKQDSRRQQREYNRQDKEQLRSSHQKQDSSNHRSYKSIKSSLKSNIKSSKNLNLNSNSNLPKDSIHYSRQQGYEIEKLSRKYKNQKNIKESKDKRSNEYLRAPQYENDYKRKPQKGNQYYNQKEKEREMQKERQRQRDRQRQRQKERYRQKERQRQKQRKLYKYKSQKYLSTNQSDIYTIEKGSGKKRTLNQRDDRKKYQRQPYNERAQYEQKNDKRHKYQQNSLEKYQKDAWMNRKNINSEKYLMMEDPRQKPSKENQKLQRKDFAKPYQREKNHKIQRSSILQMRSKYGDNHHLIRIRQIQYGNLYNSDSIEESNCSQQHVPSRTNNRPTKRQSNYKSPTRRSDNEYYQHLTPTSKQRPHKGKSSQTQISSTFDSLLLSINSHITSLNNVGFDKLSIKAIVDKVDLHMKTLDMIGDYSHEFRKMYEEVEEWEELIFLAYKKFWVERMKVMDYLKKFAKKRRHQSQRIQLKQSNNANSHKNISSPLHTGDNPFSNSSLVQNPFIIPFCKVSEEEVKKLCQSEQFPLLMQRLQKQTSQTYNSLQEMYNLIIQKSGNHINMLYCDNFSDDIYVQMLAQIEQLIPNLEEVKLFQVTKIRLGKIVKTGILVLHMNGKYVRNISEIITYDDCERIGNRKAVKTFATYDLYYEVFEKLVVE